MLRWGCGVCVVCEVTCWGYSSLAVGSVVGTLSLALSGCGVWSGAVVVGLDDFADFVQEIGMADYHSWVFGGKEVDMPVGEVYSLWDCQGLQGLENRRSFQPRLTEAG